MTERVTSPTWLKAPQDGRMNWGGTVDHNPWDVLKETDNFFFETA